MPPRQCPECGRFLKNALVESLDEASQPCPGCATVLTAAMFEGPAARGAADAESDVSVRPPDLEPETVRDVDRDVLAGWDVGATAAEVASWREDRPPLPVDAAVLTSGALLGAGFGVLCDPDRRVRGGAIGLAAGVASAVVVRRLWRLPS